MAAAAAQLPPPPVISGGPEAGSVAALDEDGLGRWSARWTTREDAIDGQPVILMTEEGEGRYSGFEGEGRWRTETLWSLAADFRPLESTKTGRGTPRITMGRTD